MLLDSNKMSSTNSVRSGGQKMSRVCHIKVKGNLWILRLFLKFKFIVIFKHSMYYMHSHSA